MGKGSRDKELTDTGRGGGIVEIMDDEGEGGAPVLDSMKSEAVVEVAKRKFSIEAGDLTPLARCVFSTECRGRRVRIHR